MKINKIITVYKKEIVETLRDKRTLFSMIGVPLLLYPILIIGLSQLMSIGAKKLEVQKSRISLKTVVKDDLRILLSEQSNIMIVESADCAKDLSERNIQAYIEYTYQNHKDNYMISSDLSVDASRQAEDRLNKVFSTYRNSLQDKVLITRGIEPEVLDVMSVSNINVAPPVKMGGMLLGMIIPLMLVVTILVGAMYPAIDTTAGEKERGTLETILSLPVEKTELFIGKFLTVATAAIITGLLNLLSMMLVYSLGVAQISQLKDVFQFSLSPAAIAVLFLLIIPLALFISAVVLSVCLYAKSFREAQNFMAPVMIVMMLPAYVGMAPGIELNPLLSVIPIVNVSLLFKEIFMNIFNINQIFMVFLSNILYAFLAIYWFSRMYNSEGILFSEGRNYYFNFKRSAVEKKERVPVTTALLVYSIVLFLIIYAGTIIQLKYRLFGVFLTEWILILMPVLFTVWYIKADFFKSLNIKGFKPLSLPGAILVWAGAFVFIIMLSSYVSKWFPQTENFGKEFTSLLTGGGNIWPSIVVIALSPAICEELLFRGLILSSFLKKLRPLYAILLTALLFGFFHLDAFRMIPTFLLGIVLTYTAYQGGSIFISVVLHFINNLAGVSTIFYPDKVNALINSLTGDWKKSAVLISAALVSLCAGLWVMSHSKGKL